MRYNYTTISTSGESQWKVKGSKHLGFAIHAPEELFINDALNQLRKAHYQANHLCYAWRLGADKLHFRANDDGEPTHSAGTPILGQIEKYDLTFVLVAVVRYFGGTKLGVGGLIDAYRTAAQMAIDAATKIEKQLMAHYTLHFGYERMSDVMLALRINGWESFEQNFQESCSLDIAVLPQNSEEVFRAFEAFHDIRTEPKGIF